MKIVSTQNVSFDSSGKIQRSVFENGSVYIHHSVPSIKRAFVQIGFLIGSSFEKKGEFGLSHLIEHLFFRAARHAPNGDVVARIEALGGEVNAYTSHDLMVFDLTCLGKDLKHILPIFFELFSEMNLTSAEFEKEKQVVIQEIKEDEGDYEVKAEEWMMEHHYGAQYGHPIGGQISDVKNLKLNQVKRFIKKHFVAEKMVGVFVTPSKHKICLEKFSQFTSLYRNKNQPLRMKDIKFKPQPFKHKSKVVKRGVDSPVVLMSFKAPELNSQERPLLILLDHILCEGMSSRLFKSLRTDQALVYGYSSSLNSYPWGGHYCLSVNAKKSDFKKIKEIILYNLQDIAENPIPKKEFKTQIYKAMRMWDLYMDDFEVRADYIVRSEFFRENFNSYVDLIKFFKRVRPNDLSLFCYKLINNGYSEVQVS
jgi:predicted Zn-dependent peptidase